MNIFEIFRSRKFGRSFLNNKPFRSIFFQSCVTFLFISFQKFFLVVFQRSHYATRINRLILHKVSMGSPFLPSKMGATPRNQAFRDGRLILPDPRICTFRLQKATSKWSLVLKRWQHVVLTSSTRLPSFSTIRHL